MQKEKKKENQGELLQLRMQRLEHRPDRPVQALVLRIILGALVKQWLLLVLSVWADVCLEEL